MTNELTWVNIFEGVDTPSFDELTIIKKGNIFVSCFTSKKEKMGLGKSEVESLENLRKLYEN